MLEACTDVTVRWDTDWSAGLLVKVSYRRFHGGLVVAVVVMVVLARGGAGGGFVTHRVQHPIRRNR